MVSCQFYSTIILTVYTMGIEGMKFFFFRYTLFLFLGLCLQSQETIVGAPFSSTAQTENINTEQNFPDSIFRRAVEEVLGVGLGEPFTAMQAAQVKELNLTSLGISDLTGIKFFTSLEILICSRGGLTSLDLSGNPALKHLNCYGNQLTTLNLSSNPALTTLYCYTNQLRTLDITGNPALLYLRCYYNQLTNLNLSGNPLLEELSFGVNQLTSLDLSNNPDLKTLTFSGNQLTTLDISRNPSLTYLTCRFNQLKSLDLSGNPFLETLHCSNNQLKSLDVSKNPALETLYCDNNQLTSLNLSENPKLIYLICSHNQITSLAGIMYNEDLIKSSLVDVTFNHLDKDDCAEIQTLLQKGVVLSYSPQLNEDGGFFLNCSLTDVEEWVGY